MAHVEADDQRRIVIVVDDERATRESVAHLFHEAGFESRCATDGLDAMLLLRRLETKPCLVLTDVKMPLMDGNALYAAVRGDPELESVPIVFMSDDIRAVHAEAPIVEKPVSLATLLETTRKYGDR